MPLLVGGLVVLLLAAALFYLLFSAHGRYADGLSNLSSVQGRLQRLTNRSVFPSETNVQTMRKQLEIYQEYLDGLFASMREGQLEAKTIDRDEFRRLLGDGLRQLLIDARAKSVAIAPNFAFGVQRYIEGASPSDEELPRLVDQFKSIAILCGILYDAGIGELISVERTVFEKDAQAAPVEEEFRRGRNRTEEAVVPTNTELYRDPDGLFTREHYVLSYRAQDKANWKVLDRLAQAAPFVVVTRMEVSNPARPAVVAPKAEEAAAPEASRPVSTAGWQSPSAGASAAPREETEILPRELRVTAGQELPNVRLEVDWYRFAETASANAAGEENP